MKTCLIVDDSKVIRMIARRIVETLGLQASEAENGEIALHACQEDMPDAVLLDWNMPVLSGIDFLRALRKMSDGCHPKVVLCTTENGIEQIQEAVEAGADEYIMKPFDREIVETKFSLVGLI